MAAVEHDGDGVIVVRAVLLLKQDELCALQNDRSCATGAYMRAWPRGHTSSDRDRAAAVSGEVA